MKNVPGNLDSREFVSFHQQEQLFRQLLPNVTHFARLLNVWGGGGRGLNQVCILPLLKFCFKKNMCYIFRSSSAFDITVEGYNEYGYFFFTKLEIFKPNITFTP
jgi:hypothetical protein